MTDPPPSGREQSPAVAALAVRVDGLRRRIETLATSIDDLTSTQQEHATVLDGITELRRQVEQILAILGNDDEPSPAQWFWLTMTDQQRGERLSELSDWVETVLRTQYPGYLAGQIRPCWPNHPEARWELVLALPALDPRLPHQPASRRKTPPTGTTAGPPASSAAWPRSCASARKPASASLATKRPQIHSAGNGSDPPRPADTREAKASGQQIAGPEPATREARNPQTS